MVGGVLSVGFAGFWRLATLFLSALIVILLVVFFRPGTCLAASSIYLDFVPKSHSENSLPNAVKSFPKDSYTPPASQPNICPHHGPMKSLTSQTQSRSSHPVLATHPSLPNRHQSTPHTNSVCRPILPNSLPCSPPKPSDPA